MFFLVYSIKVMVPLAWFKEQIESTIRTRKYYEALSEHLEEAKTPSGYCPAYNQLLKLFCEIVNFHEKIKCTSIKELK